jgi:hypothetical protein
MRLFENYNTAKQKYGFDMVNSFLKLGLPPQYLLSACRFKLEYKIPEQKIVTLFREWMSYVYNYNKTYDVNKLTYEQFTKLIEQEKSKHCLPNIIFSSEIASLGQLNSHKDVQKIPVKNQWCIKSQSWFENYVSKGYKFYVIYLTNEPSPFTYVIAAIHGGNVEYYDSNDYEQHEDLRQGKNIINSDHEAYQSKLPKQIVDYLYNIAAQQTDNMKNENKRYKNMNKIIRLTESQLHRVIKESVNRLLNELSYNKTGNKI